MPLRNGTVKKTRGGRNISLQESGWEIPASVPDLAAGDVHIWRIRLDVPQSSVQSSISLLDQDEQARAKRFRRAADRRRFIAAHATLRRILGRYVGCKPEEVGFLVNGFGKPALLTNGQSPDIHFNLAHSGELGLCCIASGREVGVDVEFIKPDFAALDVARKFFSPIEVEQFMSLPAKMRTAAFFRCWTFKEAFIKAKGRGLSISLDSFDVSLTPRRASALLSSRDDPNDVGRWHIRPVEVQQGYAAAVAVEGYPWTLIS